MSENWMLIWQEVLYWQFTAAVPTMLLTANMHSTNQTKSHKAKNWTQIRDLGS